MNNQGQMIFFGFMIMMVILVLVFGMAPGVKSAIDDARNSSEMDCDNSSISDFNKANLCKK